MTIKLDERPGPAPSDLLVAARRRFMHGEKLDIAGLAEDLGISRATAYRWAGNVEELTGAIIASLAAANHRRAFAEAAGEGAERLIDAYRRGLQYISSGPYRDWVTREDPETVLRIVASKFGPVQGISIRMWEEVLTEEVRSGRLALAVEPHKMAYTVVRLAESFLYADLIAGEEPDVETCVEIFKLLLR